jgi:hypothetical protein
MFAQLSPIPVGAHPIAPDVEQRKDKRPCCSILVTTHSLEAPFSLTWGASVQDVSDTGIGLILCFPFRVGTHLGLELCGAGPDAPAVNVCARVDRVRDQQDSSWHVDCTFVEALSKREVESLF